MDDTIDFYQVFFLFPALLLRFAESISIVRESLGRYYFWHFIEKISMDKTYLYLYRFQFYLVFFYDQEINSVSCYDRFDSFLFTFSIRSSTRYLISYFL